jgi:predicted AlkP superfamily phosphohydrolase/phosphomutase
MTDHESTAVTLIGLDGVSWALIDDVTTHADVPVLSSLVDESVHGTTTSTIPSLTCPALPTLYTGKNPGNLGIFDFVKPDGSLVDYTDVTEPAVWDYLSDRDVSMVVGAMRTTHPAPRINGVFISDVLSTAEEPDYVTPEIAREYGDRFHEQRELLEAAKKGGPSPALLDAFVEMNNTRSDVFLALLDEYDPDFALLWFGLSDGVQHYFWDDPESLRTFFEAFDDRLGRILDARSESNVVVVGDHGFGPATKYRFHLNDVLHEGGYLTLQGGVARAAATKLSYRLSELYLDDRWKRRALDLVNRFKRNEPTDKESSSGRDRTVVSPLNTIPGIDWSETVAHVSTRKGWGINLVEENIDGDPDELRDEIIEYITQVTAPNGAPAIKDAWPGEEIYWGRYGDQVPDIVYLAHDELRVRPSVVGKRFTRHASSYVGTHESAREAVFMARGPDVVREEPVGAVELYDIAPTLIHLTGNRIPETLDGEVVDLTSRPVTHGQYHTERYRIRNGLRAVSERL